MNPPLLGDCDYVELWRGSLTQCGDGREQHCNGDSAEAHAAQGAERKCKLEFHESSSLNWIFSFAIELAARETLAPARLFRRYLVINMKYPMNLSTGTRLLIVKNNGGRLLVATTILGAVVMVAQPLRGQVQPTVGLINPRGVAFSSATGKAYTVDQRRGTVDITDDATGSTVHVKVGAGPVSIAVNGANGMVYVANGDDEIG